MFHYQNGTLYCESVALTQLAKNYQTPLYVYSKNTIIDNYQVFRQAFASDKHWVCYAVKANSNLAVLNTLAQQGAGFDVVSKGELMRVVAAGGQASRCVYSGVAKSTEEICYGLENNIFCFNIESEAELLRIAQVAKDLGKIAPISVRINPDIDPKTHPYIATGLKDNKFGVAPDKVLNLYLQAQKIPHIQPQGIDCHIGSQITKPQPFLQALVQILLLMGQLQQHGIPLKHINLGGGMGIIYKDGDALFDTQAYIKTILERTQNYQIILEPGRTIVGNAGVFLTRVEFLKDSYKKSFAIVDGAMNDLLRPSLYQAYHPVLPLMKNNKGRQANWDIVGPVCESGDFLAKNRKLSLNEGDFLALMCAGAYGFAMSSNYNSRPRAAEVMVDKSEHRLIRRRETIAELFSHENV